MNFVSEYFSDVVTVAKEVDGEKIERLAGELASLRLRRGRLFFIGVGGSASNCSHAVNDFRKLCSIEAYSPLDNVSELTARANDEGWEHIFTSWLKGSFVTSRDALFVLSVGGGSMEHNVSPNIVKAIQFAKTSGMSVYGIVGPKGGYTKEQGDIVISVPIPHEKLTTPLAEAFQAVIWHCLVSHPSLQIQKAKWESLEPSSLTATV